MRDRSADVRSQVADANCEWVGGDEDLSDGCACAGASQADVDRFGEGYGSRCAAWDQHAVDTMWPSYGPYERTADSGDGWACESWCYIENPEACADAAESWTGEGVLYFSWNACDNDAALVENCPRGRRVPPCATNRGDTNLFGADARDVPSRPRGAPRGTRGRATFVPAVGGREATTTRARPARTSPRPTRTPSAPTTARAAPPTTWTRAPACGPTTAPTSSTPIPATAGAATSLRPASLSLGPGEERT